MFSPPPLQSWDAMHPLVIHFPIALLLIAPLFILLGMVVPKSGKTFSYAALILVLLGTVGAYVAVSTGKAAESVVVKTDDNREAIEEHEELGVLTRNVFTALTLIYAAIILGPAIARKPLGKWLRVITHGAFFLAYAVCCMLVVNTAHLGGRLVHEFEILALMFF